MDKAERQLLERYFDAARNEPGISEADAWAMFNQRLASGKPSPLQEPGRGWSTLITLLLLATLGVIVLLVIRSGSDAPVKSTSSTIDQSPQAAQPNVSDTLHLATIEHSGDSSGAREQSDQQGHERQVRRHSADAIAQEAPATPRQPSVVPEIDSIRTAEQFNAGLGKVASNFWRMRLNEYRNRINAMLSDQDRDTLDRLRTRFASLSWRWANNVDSATDRSDVGARLMEAYQATMPFIDGNAEGYDSLRTLMTTDFGQYFALLRSSADSLVVARSSEIDSTTLAIRLNLDRADTIMAQLERQGPDGESRMMFMMMLAPMTTLYAGQSLKAEVEGIEMMMTIGGMPMSIRSLPGFATLPEASPLRVLDMTTDKPTIEYAVSEPAHATFTIYNDAGEMISSYDDGQQERGDHRIALDKTPLPPATYLIQLKLTTSRGEQVFSRIIQIERHGSP